MNLGYGASCRKVAEDEKAVLYEYSVYNLANENWLDMFDTYDGIITINKFIKDGSLKTFHIDNSRNAFRLSKDNVDLLAVHLIYHLYIKFKECNVFPSMFSFDC